MVAHTHGAHPLWRIGGEGTMAVPGGSSSIQSGRGRRTSAERRPHRITRRGLTQGHVEPPPSPG
eukprot:3170843-Pyramimonas_sp.AAC.2